MKINPVKLKRQEKVIQRWKANGAKGTLQAVTGFGKTFVAILIIKDMNERKPERETIVIVPTDYLRKQWVGHVKEHNLLNVTVLTPHKAVKARRQCSLLVCDEIHNYASNIFRQLFRVVRHSFLLGLTATLERKDNRHIIIERYAPVIDTIDMKEALANGYVSDFKVFNLGIEMNDKDKEAYKKLGSAFGKSFSWFMNDFDLAMKCLRDENIRVRHAKYLNLEPQEVFIHALNFSRNMRKRKDFLYHTHTKVDLTKEIIQAFPDRKTIVFSQATSFADQLAEELPGIALAYHSNIKGVKKKREVIRRYNDPKDACRVLSTSKSMDEGSDIEGVSLAIVASGTSSSRQDLQRTGRAIRYMEGKLGIIINLYVKNTQDVKWLRARQAKAENVIEVDSLDEIIEHIEQYKTQLVA